MEEGRDGGREGLEGGREGGREERRKGGKDEGKQGGGEESKPSGWVGIRMLLTLYWDYKLSIQGYASLIHAHLVFDGW